MHLYIDSGDIAEIEQAAKTGLISGVTTNPTLISKSVHSGTFEQALKKICAIMRKYVKSFTVSAEVTAKDAKGMVREGVKLARIDPAIIIKVPMTPEGMLAVQQFTKKKIRTNVTLIFSANQALLAAKAGAFVVSPFMGRLDDIGQDSTELIEDILTIFDNYDMRTMVLAASIRTPRQVTEAALVGAHIATLPATIFHKLYTHPLTDQGIAAFDRDWEKFISS